MGAAIWAAALLQAAQPQTCPAEAARIVDLHLHAYSDESLTRRVPNPAMRSTQSPGTAAAHRAAVLAAMREAGVVRAFVGSAGSTAADQLVAESGERVRRSYQISGVPTEADLVRIRQLHAAGALELIGEIMPAYSGIGLDDPRLEPLWALAEELNLPVGVHSGSGPPDQHIRGNPRSRLRAGDPILLDDVMARHPRLQVILMHMGWPMLDSTLAMLNGYSTVHVDTGAIAWLVPRAEFHRYLQRLVDAGYGRRILFGSDQMIWPEGIGMAVEAVRSASFLTEEQRADIFHGNAQRLFGWTDLPAC